MIQSIDFESFAEFLMDIDALKLGDRRSYIAGGSRLENSAEHSWHVAVAAWTLAERSNVPVSMERVLKLALVHDLCELDGGDTFIHTAEREQQLAQEQECVTRLMQAHGELLGELEALWQEYENGRTPEAKFVRIVDRLLPFLHNLANQGRTWQEHQIKRSQVQQLYSPMESDFPALVSWVYTKVDDAVNAGWLLEG